MVCEGMADAGGDIPQDEEVAAESARDDVDQRAHGEITRMLDNQEEFHRKYSRMDDADKWAFFMRSSRALDEERTSMQVRLITRYKDAFNEQLRKAIGLVQTLQKTDVTRPEDARGFEQAAKELVSELDGMRTFEFQEFIQVYARCIDGKKLDKLMKDGEGTTRYFPETASLYKILARLVSNESSAQKFIGVRNKMDHDWYDKKTIDWPEEDPEVYEESDEAGAKSGFTNMFRMMVAQQTDDRTVSADSPDVKWWTDRARTVLAARSRQEDSIRRASRAFLEMAGKFNDFSDQDWPLVVTKRIIGGLVGAER